jgi:hypothetical protein
VTEVVPSAGGQLSTVHEVRCADPTDTAIFKVYADEWRWKQAKEVHVYRLIADQTAWPVPEVLHHAADGGPDNRAVTILSLLEGRPFSGWEVTGLIDVENAIAADPLIDLAKTDYYSLGRGEPERTALLEGYGPLPADAAERLDLYRLYHALELWDWFCSIGTTGPLKSIADDIARLAG